MSVAVPGRLNPFPEKEISRVCRVVGGTAIADKAGGFLALGRNHGGVGDATAAYTAALLDDVAVGDVWPFYVFATSVTAYPTTGGSASLYPIFGINASGASIADDGKGKFVFEGAVRATLTLTTATDDHIPGSIVFLNSGSTNALSVTHTTADIDTGDLIVGRTLEYITNTTAATVDTLIWLNGINADWVVINAA